MSIRSQSDDESAADSPSESKLSKDDIGTFTQAVERRIGRGAYEDWRVIGAIYKKASDLARKETDSDLPLGSRYNKAFHRILADLPPIAANKATAERYRTALLKIERNEPEFSHWYAKNPPRVENPVALLQAFNNRNQPPTSRPKGRAVTQAQRELMQLQADLAVRIQEFDELKAKYEPDPPVETNGFDPQQDKMPRQAQLDARHQRLDSAMQQAWHAGVVFANDTSIGPDSIFAWLLERLATLAFKNGYDDVDDLISLADDAIRNSYAEFKEQRDRGTTKPH
jgi:hypothetical protein